MGHPTITTLLNGYLLSSDQGNAAFCGAYLIEGRDSGHRRTVLYDCGHVGRRRMLLAALSERGLTPADVDTVVLSHAHWDHMQNVDLFDRAQVLVHPRELRDLEAAALPGGSGAPRWAGAVLASVAVRETGDGDRILPGVEVIALPGHTPGSIGVSVATGAGLAVLTGDAVGTAGCLRTGRCLGIPYDAGKAAASVRRVAALADTVHPGHDRPFRLTGGGEVEYLTDPVPITFRVIDPQAMAATVRFVAHPAESERPPGTV